MGDERGKVILKTQDDSEADEATSPTACSGASMDDILQALHSLGKQDNGIENKIELGLSVCVTHRPRSNA